MGFSAVVEVDSRTGIYPVWKHRQDFPYVGRLDNSWVFRPNGPPFYTLATEDPVWNHAQWNQNSGILYFVYEDSRTTSFYEVGGPSNGQLVRTIARDPTYETTYGSVDLETITTTAFSGEVYTTTIDYALQHLTGPWCVGMPDTVTVTRSGYLMTPQTRTVDNVFDASTCRLESTTNTSETDQSKQLKTSYGYDTIGNIKTVTLNSANGGAGTQRRTELFYDAAGHVPTSVKRYVTGEFDHTESLTWDYRFLLPASQTDPRGTTAFQYDEFGRIFREDRPDGTYTTWLRGLCTGCIGSTDGLYFDREGPVNELATTRWFDTYGRLFSSSSGSSQTGVLVQWTGWRDHLGRVEQEILPYETTPAFSVHYTYDLANRLIQEDRPVSEAQPSGAISTWIYDKLTTTVTEPGNPGTQTTTYSKDALDRIMRVTDSGSGLTQYEYNAFDQLTKATDPAGHFTTIGYNNRGDKTSMSDPDMGFWQYDYNVFGELTWQRDAKLQQVLFGYDQLGRLDWRSEPEFPGATGLPDDDGRTDWAYYNTADHRHGLLEYELAPDAYEREYYYDTLGRLNQQRTVIDGTGYWTDLTYHPTGIGQGKLQRITYPQSTGGVRVQVDYEYGTSGLVYRVKDGAAGTIFYQVNDLDPLLRETQATIGGISHTSVYDRASLALKTIQTGPAAAVQNLEYKWYPSGNLKERVDYFSGRTETFTYDALNRLDTQTLNGGQILNVDYAAGGDGNIGFKSGVGYYGYGGASGGPHAVTSITGLQSNSYVYDANGNMTNRDGDAITWYSHNLPKRVNYGADSTEFWYGTDRNRYKQVAVEGGSTTTTRYVGDHFEVESRAGLTIYRHFVRAGDQVIAQIERRSDGSNPIRYLHRDHLASIVATTDGGGAIQQRFELEPYGTRWRTAGGGADDSERGFTGHEHLDSVDLIHMNGRVQDPVLGRFISADPFVSAPYHSQSLNRYSYVWNNPLTLVDPSGFDPEGTPGASWCANNFWLCINPCVWAMCHLAFSDGATDNPTGFVFDFSAAAYEMNRGAPQGATSHGFVSRAHAQEIVHPVIERNFLVGTTQFNYSVSGPPGYALAIAGMLDAIAGTESGAAMLEGIAANATLPLLILHTNRLAGAGYTGCAIGSFFCDGTYVQFSPTRAQRFTGLQRNARVLIEEAGTALLAHELFHIWQYTGTAPDIGPQVFALTRGGNGREPFAVRYTNRIRRELRYPYVRTDYFGIDIREY